jgi:hypothetical protein
MDADKALVAGSQILIDGCLINLQSAAMRKYHRRVWQPPARDVVAKFSDGEVAGIRRLASILNVPLNTIYSWLYTKEDGGSGGFIPIDHHRTILTAARELGITLTPAELTGLQEFDEPKQVRKLSRKAAKPLGSQPELRLQAAE